VRRSITTTPRPAGRAGASGSLVAARIRAALERVDPAWVGAFFVLFAIAVYVLSNGERRNFYNHFVWQADAYLHGRVEIPYRYDDGVFSNVYFQDVLPLPDRPGFALLPFPPLPALVLLPFVAVFGLATDAALVAAVLGAFNVGLCWRMLLRVAERRDAAVLGTLFYGFGTVAWYAAMLGSTWFLAHVVASTFLLLAITAALDAERRFTRAHRSLALVDPRQFVAGLLLGTAAVARLPVAFGAPFFMLVGGGGSLWRRSFSAGLGAVIPVGLLVAYNLATTGHVFHPAYEYLYETEYTPRPEFIHREWDIEDPRYIPQNAAIMLAWPPETPLSSDDECTDPAHPEYRQPPRGIDVLLDRTCPILRPDPVGMSLLLTSPAYLLALPLVARAWRRRLVAGAALAVVAIALVNLMHFSQGWVQFGYRFSNDFAPFAVLLVGAAIGRYGVRPLTLGLVGLSVLVNAWGVYWGVALGW
jgi:hypothetical protein